MTTPKPTLPTKFGTICHAGGAEILIEARYREWVDWANLALYSHSPMLAALKAAQIALASNASDERRLAAAELVASAITKGEGF